MAAFPKEAVGKNRRLADVPGFYREFSASLQYWALR